MPTVSLLAASAMMALFAAIVGAWIWAILRLAFGLPILPPDTPRVVPWRAGSVLAAILCWFALQLAVPTVYLAAIRPRPAVAGAEVSPRVPLRPGEMMTLSAVQNAATLLVVPLVLAATAGARPRDFGLGGVGLGREFARGLVAYPLLAPIVFGVMILSVLTWGKTPHPLEDAIVQDRAPGMVAILVLAGVVLAPIAEEMIFRGVLLGWLTRLALGGPKKGPAVDPDFEWGSHGAATAHSPHLPETMDELDEPGQGKPPGLPETGEDPVFNPDSAPESTPEPARAGSRSGRLLAANAIVSLVFAALHGAVWPTPVPIFFLSLGLGVLYQRTGGIAAPIALHMSFNGVSTLLLFLTLGGQAPGAAPKPKLPDPSPPPALAPADPGRIGFVAPAR